MKINWIITATIGLASQKTITAIYVKQSTNFKNSMSTKKVPVTTQQLLRNMAFFFFPNPESVLNNFDKKECLHNKTKELPSFPYI